jgi:hypothetical protein
VTDRTADRRFYEEVPKRQLWSVFRIGLFGITLGGFGMFYFRSVPDLVRLYAFLLLVLSAITAWKLLYLIFLLYPMLTLTRRYLIYRKVRIPWDLITSVTEVKISTHSYVGIAIRGSILQVTPLTNSPFPSLIMAPILRKHVAKYGAILIPQARGITTDELRRTIEEYGSWCSSAFQARRT